MLTPLCVTYSVGFPNFSQPAALPPLALRAALAVVSVTQIFSASGAWGGEVHLRRGRAFIVICD